MSIIVFKPSNTVFSTPFIVFNIVLELIPYIPRMLKQGVYVLNNFLCLLIDSLIVKFANFLDKKGIKKGKHKFSEAIYWFPVGKSVIGKK